MRRRVDAVGRLDHVLRRKQRHEMRRAIEADRFLLAESGVTRIMLASSSVAALLADAGRKESPQRRRFHGESLLKRSRNCVCASAGSRPASRGTFMVVGGVPKMARASVRPKPASWVAS